MKTSLETQATVVGMAAAVLLTLFAFETGVAQTLPDGPYFGQNPPGLTPVVFAPGIISLTNRNEGYPTFAPDGTEFYFVVAPTYASPSQQIYYTRQVSGHWTPVALAPFSNTNNNSEPCYAPDGRHLYFISNRPPGGPGWNFDIWWMARTNDGWATPQRLGSAVNSTYSEYTPVVALSGTLYFTSARGSGQYDIYMSALVNGQYPSIQKLPSPINTTSYDEDEPFIAPDESYLLFSSGRPGGYGNEDLYVSFKQRNGNWSTPRNLGPTINNTSLIQYGPRVSPDGKYLFFSRTKSWGSDMGNNDIFWVKSDVFTMLHPIYQTYADFQNFYFGSTNAPGSGPDEDPDGDGASNYLEYLTGTDPLDSNSVWRVAAQLGDDGQVQIVFPNPTNATFQVEWTLDLGSPAWTPLDVAGGSAQVIQEGNQIIVEDLNASDSRRFYRVRLQASH